MSDAIESTHMHLNKGRAYGRQGKTLTGIIFNIVDYCSQLRRIFFKWHGIVQLSP